MNNKNKFEQMLNLYLKRFQQISRMGLFYHECLLIAAGTDNSQLKIDTIKNHCNLGKIFRYQTVTRNGNKCVLNFLLKQTI